MTDTETLLIERACEKLVIDSATFNDHKNWSALAGLYATDGSVERPNGEVSVGRETIEATYAAGQANRLTRHILANLRVHVDAADAAHATTLAIIYFCDANDTPNGHMGIKANAGHLIGEFEDTFVLTDDGWRISTRIARMIMHT
jgi:hypothetical protein